jgi:hypothetical protein
MPRASRSCGYRLVAAGGWMNRAARCDFLKAERLFLCFSRAKGTVEPVGFWIAQQDEVNHRCQQKEEHTLRHEYATRIKDQPDFVKLCHLYSP